MNAELVQQLEGEKQDWWEVLKQIVKEGCLSVAMMNSLDHNIMVTFLAYWKS